MKDELISYETAVLAKDKGFDAFCLHYYNKKGELPERWESSGSSTDTDVPIYLEEFEENYNLTGRVDAECSAPTQSLLQRWLREVHGIDIAAIPYDIKNKEKSIQTPGTLKIGKTIHPGEYIFDKKYIWFIGSFDIINICDKNFNIKTLIIFNTYEEALEAGLLESLKLIKDDSKTKQ